MGFNDGLERNSDARADFCLVTIGLFGFPSAVGASSPTFFTGLSDEYSPCREDRIFPICSILPIHILRFVIEKNFTSVSKKNAVTHKVEAKFLEYLSSNHRTSE
jgi:hypothetical protein